MSSNPTAGERTRLRVRYAETDQMGRAHHMHYLAWFELGRTELLRGAGVAYSEIESQGVKLPVSNVEIEYRSPAGYDEAVDIFTRVSRVRSRTVTFSYLGEVTSEVLVSGTFNGWAATRMAGAWPMEEVEEMEEFQGEVD